MQNPNDESDPVLVRAWPTILPGDYHAAVLRLATLTSAKVNHLLFASVELLPTEIVAAPPPPGGGFWTNLGGVRFCLGRTVLPVADALDWYGTLWEGRGHVPGIPHQVTTPPLGAEPDYPGFVLASDAPFSPRWHERPRIHHLLPMGMLAETVVAVRDGSTAAEPWIGARAWLRERLHFDLLAYDEWLGSAVLIAPNPLLRGCGVRITGRNGAGEAIELGGQPRRGADLSTVDLVVEEKRAGATGWRASGAPNSLGRLYATAPSQLAAVRHELSCSLRGALDQSDPGWFLRSVSTGGWQQGSQRVVDPPRREPGSPTFTVRLRPKDDGPPPPPKTPLRKLEWLQRDRAERAGARAPAERSAEPATVHILEQDRAEAVLRIRRLVAQAREQILFVDPYLDADDLQQFAMAAEQEGVAIRGLINSRPAHIRKADADGETVGEMLRKKIEDMRDLSQGFGSVDIRVSTRRRLHDRFLQIDQAVWHCGHSFNQVGKGEVSLMTQVARPAEIREILAEAFAEAEPFERYWSVRPNPTRSWRRTLARWLRAVAKRLDHSAVARSTTE